jgi:hypothetical protein
VKVYVDATGVPDGPAAGGPASSRTAPAAGPGRDYLRRRRQEVSRRDEARRHATASADRLDAALARVAIDRRQHPPQDPGLAGGTGGPNVFNAAYLVDAARVAEFAALAQRIGADARVAVTGPWPAYSFAAGLGDGVDDPARGCGPAADRRDPA